ncbi:uncharacterized protein LOC112083089 [Eutrema salsugineum]|uniref:uncharacterized protein LOC112083089 n=1 Tax=Eutrema salsugineum TaxID=72664 RepID=UPI000CED27C7|nr:uncharacterized protein LOC112083089 [Eutrema salsugineum]
MLLERWTANPPADFLTKFEVWIQIANIPMNFYTAKTMFELAKAVGQPEEIAYDPKRSQKTEFVRARVTFDISKPARDFKDLNLPTGERVVIEYKYEKLRKKCFHCLRLTHEKSSCPQLRKSQPRGNPYLRASLEARRNINSVLLTAPVTTNKALEAPPGFSPLLPGPSREGQKSNLRLVTHVEDADKLVRIERVQQSTREATDESMVKLPVFTTHLDKGKGHVFGFEDSSDRLKRRNINNERPIFSAPGQNPFGDSDTENSTTHSFPLTAPTRVPTVFRLGSGTQALTSGNSMTGRKYRRRPQAWKRRPRSNISTPTENGLLQENTIKEGMSKRKAGPPSVSSPSKSPKPSEKTVASSLKPLQSQ